MPFVHVALGKGIQPPLLRAHPPRSTTPAMLPLSMDWPVWKCPMVLHVIPGRGTGSRVLDKEPSQGRPSLNEGHQARSLTRFQHFTHESDRQLFQGGATAQPPPSLGRARLRVLSAQRIVGVNYRLRP